MDEVPPTQDVDPCEDEYRLPRPSMRLPLALMLAAGVAFLALATIMSDIGHAVGSAIGGAVFVVGAGYIAWHSRRP